MEKGKISSLGQRLIRIRGKDNAAVFAEKVGVHKNTLGRYESGERFPDAKFLEAIARLGINIHWLVTGVGPERQSAADINAHWIKDQRALNSSEPIVDQIYLRISEVKQEKEPVEQDAGLAFTHDFLVNQLNLDPAQTHLFRCVGDSMTPAFHHHDWVLVDCREIHQNALEGHYLIQLSGKFLIRRVQVLPGHNYELIADNPVYSRITIDSQRTSKNDFRVVGRVVWAGLHLR